MPRVPITLSSDYYRDHFYEMMRFVSDAYGDIFDGREKDFLENFSRLGIDAQCVFIRMSNRKRAVFRVEDLCYAEIGDIAAALDELLAEGWIRPVAEDDYATLLATLTKASLMAVLQATGCIDLRLSWGKNKVLARILADVPFASFCLHHPLERHYVPAHQDVVQFLTYLYFGKTGDGLTSFALRDLGIIQTRERPTYAARFSCRDDASASFFYASMLKRLKAGRAADFDGFAARLGTMPAAMSEYAQTLRSAALHLLGQHYEKAGDVERALAVYALSEGFESRERLVRLLHAMGRKDAAEEFLSAMLANPDCDDEYFFAADFYARKYGRQKLGAHTAMLRAAASISVAEYYKGSAEHAVLLHYKQQGWDGWHSENTLWHAVFGLMYWDELFEGPGALGCGFDRIPHLLRTKAFAKEHQDALARKRAALLAGDAAPIIRATCAAHRGERNGIFSWSDSTEDLALRFIDAAPPTALADMLEKIAADYFATNDGFPDLLLIRGDEIRFVEVKAEGDQIRRRQLTRFNQLRSAGFDVDILRVEYHVDPDQVYVVVDVETTGGRAPAHRVTEIGAVKVRNGQVIGEWTSLINPERAIPWFIVEKIGITDAMVADAPVFADIADDLAAFLEGAVFVAHNVEFDYEFIGAEFRRLERSFRMPKLCTVTAMRRNFPGLASYSLKELCREFGISLTQHHRALCDARAAAGLLNLTTEKRAAAGTGLAA